MKEKVGVVDGGGLDVERAIKNGSPWKRVEGGGAGLGWSSHPSQGESPPDQKSGLTWTIKSIGYIGDA